MWATPKHEKLPITGFPLASHNFMYSWCQSKDTEEIEVLNETSFEMTSAEITISPVSLAPTLSCNFLVFPIISHAIAEARPINDVCSSCGAGRTARPVNEIMLVGCGSAGEQSESESSATSFARTEDCTDGADGTGAERVDCRCSQRSS
eukprot:TRINITY_DN6530_c0_g1_i2.p1 TRINITY_DN6530_c0_g1~~TRINITY_DN6530_c0_g1_i2.p1  ORF type:complete len:149 (+),score=17.97 TRINITY_DN6530_c0_g1_i2:121-567(+)